MKLQDGSGMSWLKQNVLHQITVPLYPTLLMNTSIVIRDPGLWLKTSLSKATGALKPGSDHSLPHRGCVLKDVLRSHWSCLAMGTTPALHSISLWPCSLAGATTTLMKNGDLNLCGQYCYSSRAVSPLVPLLLLVPCNSSPWTASLQSVKTPSVRLQRVQQSTENSYFKSLPRVNALSDFHIHSSSVWIMLTRAQVKVKWSTNTISSHQPTDGKLCKAGIIGLLL